MKVVIAIDSFKGSVSSIEAAQAIQAGIESVNNNAEVVIKPLADGGEGTVEALVDGMNGTFISVDVCGPIGETVTAQYGILGDGVTAVMEMAQAAGLPQVPVEKRNPLHTTTYGVGEMIADAIKRGCRHFIMGIGGSATNDAGIGMLQALGYSFLDENGEVVGLGGQVMGTISQIDSANVLPELASCTFHIACDVTNPMYGENGAAYVYGPQKGATPEMVQQLDEGLRSFAEVIKRENGKDVASVPGAGAAGALGAGFLGFLPAELKPGIDIVIEQTGLKEAMSGADVVITGEGRMDFQTAMGKAPVGVAKLAKQYGAKVIAFAGAVTHDAVKVNEEGIDAFFSIANGPMSLEEAMEKEQAMKNLQLIAQQVFRLM